MRQAVDPPGGPDAAILGGRGEDAAPDVVKGSVVASNAAQKVRYGGALVRGLDRAVLGLDPNPAVRRKQSDQGRRVPAVDGVGIGIHEVAQTGGVLGRQTGHRAHGITLHPPPLA